MGLIELIDHALVTVGDETLACEALQKSKAEIERLREQLREQCEMYNVDIGQRDEEIERLQIACTTLHAAIQECEISRDNRMLERDEAREEIERLTRELKQSESLNNAYRKLPEEYHKGMLELLVKASFEAAEISHGRAAELLQCSYQEIRKKGWVQGKKDEEIERLQDALRQLVDLQNGPPLPTYRQAWEEAMRAANECLGRGN